MDKNNSLLYRSIPKIPDLFITLPISIIGILIILWLFYLDITINKHSLFDSIALLLKSEPLIFAAMYLWLKSLIQDIARIKSKIDLMMPGEIYLFSGFQWFVMYLGQDLLFKSSLVPHSQLKQYFFYENTVFIWILVDILVAVLLKITYERKYKNIQLTKEGSFEVGIMKGFASSYIAFLLITSLSLLIPF